MWTYILKAQHKISSMAYTSTFNVAAAFGFHISSTWHQQLQTSLAPTSRQLRRTHRAAQKRDGRLRSPSRAIIVLTRRQAKSSVTSNYRSQHVATSKPTEPPAGCKKPTEVNPLIPFEICAFSLIYWAVTIYKFGKTNTQSTDLAARIP